MEEPGAQLWESWVHNNKELFQGISPDAQIAFLPMEVFNSLEGQAIILGTEGDCAVRLNRVGFSGFQQLPADILFVASRSTLEKLQDCDICEQSKRFKQYVRQREILFYILVPANELENKGYTFFLDSLGMGFLGTCVG